MKKNMIFGSEVMFYILMLVFFCILLHFFKLF